MRLPPSLKLGLVALAIGLLVWLGLRYDLAPYLGPERIEAMLASAGMLAPLALIGMMAVSVVISPLPSLPIDIAAGAFFGPLLGTLYAATGALLGAVMSFGIARLLGRELVERSLGGHISFCETCSDRLLSRFVFLSRLVPVLSFDLVSYGVGLTKMSLRSFSLATFLGSLPLTFIYTSSGPFLLSGSAASIGLGLGMVVFFLVLPLLIERYDPFGLSRLFSHAPAAPLVGQQEAFIE